MPTSKQGAEQEFQAFCLTCPEPDEVTGTLHTLGMKLVFEMPASPRQIHMQLPGLPAQFHYEAACGPAVIYLAGKDEVWEGHKLPAHASRFWVYSGADPQATQRVMQALETHWSLHWQRTSSNTTYAMQDVA